MLEKMYILIYSLKAQDSLNLEIELVKIHYKEEENTFYTDI